MRLVQHLTSLITSPVCALCAGDGQWGDEPWGFDLCGHCERACPRIDNPCPRCGLPLEDDSAVCARCRTAAPPFDGVFCPFRYADPVDQMITHLKFQHDLAFARVLGTLLARAWRASSRPPPDCLIPLPLHGTRLRERGFCQTTAIARHVVRRLRGAGRSGPRLRSDLLVRTRATRAQSGLAAAERAANLQAAFRVRGVGPLPRRIALFDDVLTTGATAVAATQALKAAGAAHVEIWCCARALRHEDHAPACPPARPAGYSARLA